MSKRHAQLRLFDVSDERDECDQVYFLQIGIGIPEPDLLQLPHLLLVQPRHADPGALDEADTVRLR